LRQKQKVVEGAVGGRKSLDHTAPLRRPPRPTSIGTRLAGDPAKSNAATSTATTTQGNKNAGACPRSRASSPTQHRHAANRLANPTMPATPGGGDNKGVKLGEQAEC